MAVRDWELLQDLGAVEHCWLGSAPVEAEIQE